MEFFTLLRHRKSTRRFTDRQLSPEELAGILAAANSAPVGSNLYRDLHLTVVQNRDVLDTLSQAAAKRWQDKATVQKIAGDTPTAEPDARQYDPFYGAPAVIFVSHRQQDLQPGIEFSNVACVAHSMHLAATDLGLGSVLMWFVLESMRVIPALDHTAALQLPDGFAPLIGLAVGHPQTALTSREPRTDKITVQYL